MCGGDSILGQINRITTTLEIIEHICRKITVVLYQQYVHLFENDFMF